MGIALTRYSPRSIISREVALIAAQTAAQMGTRLYQAKIREATAIKEAQARRQSIFEYAPKSNVAADYMALVEEILGEGRKGRGQE
jgi:chromosome partitioning protein